jgi:hypothetical protein
MYWDKSIFLHKKFPVGVQAAGTLFATFLFSILTL